MFYITLAEWVEKKLITFTSIKFYFGPKLFCEIVVSLSNAAIWNGTLVLKVMITYNKV